MLTAEHDRTFDPERWERYREACNTAGEAVGILVVPGIEYSDADNVVHIPVWGGADVPFLGAGRASDELIAAAADAGAVAVLAHPGRKDAWRRLDARSLEALGGVEVWNRKYDGWAPGPIGTELADRHSLVPFFGLDSHTHRQFFPLAMGIAEAGATNEELLDALRARRCRPIAFGGDGSRFLSGPGRGAARAAEGARRAARPAVRKVREVRAFAAGGAKTN